MFKIIVVLCFLGVVCGRLPGPDYYDEVPGPDPFYYRRTRGDKPESATKIFSQNEETKIKFDEFGQQRLPLKPTIYDPNTAEFKPKKSHIEFHKKMLEKIGRIFSLTPEDSGVKSDRPKRAWVLFNPDTCEILQVFMMPYEAPYSPRNGPPEYNPAPALERTCH